jgi:cell division protein FtsB
MSSARSASAAPRYRAARKPARPRRVSAPRGPTVRVRWDRIGRFALLVVLTVVVGLYIQHALSYLSTRSEAHRKATIVQRLEKENAALTKEQAALNDPATIQRDARALGMVKVGEKPYVITGLPRH